MWDVWDNKFQLLNNQHFGPTAKSFFGSLYSCLRRENSDATFVFLVGVPCWISWLPLLLLLLLLLIMPLRLLMLLQLMQLLLMHLLLSCCCCS